MKKPSVDVPNLTMKVNPQVKGLNMHKHKIIAVNTR